jgi:hypothetical protein
MPLHILDVVQFGSKGIIDINDDDLPVGLFLIEQSHDAEDLDLLDLTAVADELADLAHVKGIVVAFCFSFGVDDVGVFPCLHPKKILLAHGALIDKMKAMVMWGNGMKEDHHT